MAGAFPTSCAVLDTNAYRRLGRHRTEAEARRKGAGIAARNRLHGIQALAHPLVVVELAAHLANPGDPVRLDCLSSLFVVWEHCKTTLGGYPQLATIEDAETQCCVFLYGATPLENHSAVEKISTLSRRIGESRGEESLSSLASQLGFVATMAAENEQEFVDDMLRYVVQGFDPTARDWSDLAANAAARSRASAFLDSPESLVMLAERRVIKAREALGFDGDEPDLTAYADRLLSHLGAPLHLYHDIVKRIVREGCDVSKPKHRNWVWDLEIANAAGNYTVRGGLPVVFVSDDQAIVDAARSAGFGDRVMSFNEYSDYLRNPPVSQ